MPVAGIGVGDADMLFSLIHLPFMTFRYNSFALFKHNFYVLSGTKSIDIELTQ
jgi:hypothetical protein